MTMLVILDGFGYRKERHGNAIAQASMPNWNYLVHHYPHELLGASGQFVGLPDGFMGNSEVGHLCMGAGRVVRTSFCKIHNSIEDGSFFSNKLLISKLTELKNKNHSFHIMGLLSDSGVHSHDSHIYALLKLAKSIGVENTFVHAFLDGRDTPPMSAGVYLKKLQDFCEKENYGSIASIHGRFYSMDRDNNWDRIKKSYDVMVGDTEVISLSWQDALESSYENNITDEFVEPVLFNKNGAVRDGDGIFFINFRPDRARQLTKYFLERNSLSFFVSPVRYAEEFKELNNDILFEDEEIKDTLLDLISGPVFIIAETEKYAHVTYFFRGKVDVQLPNETRVLVPSKKVRTYVDHPEMSASEITRKIVESLKEDPAYFYLVNYANCDMVGHSGNLEAVIKACECVDEQLGILYKEVVEKRDGNLFIVGDHGNAEEPKTSHTTNPVPFVIVNKSLVGDYGGFDECEVKDGLASVAAKILQME